MLVILSSQSILRHNYWILNRHRDAKNGFVCDWFPLFSRDNLILKHNSAFTQAGTTYLKDNVPSSNRLLCLKLVYL